MLVKSAYVLGVYSVTVGFQQGWELHQGGRKVPKSFGTSDFISKGWLGKMCKERFVLVSGEENGERRLWVASVTED